MRRTKDLGFRLSPDYELCPVSGAYCASCPPNKSCTPLPNSWGKLPWTGMHGKRDESSRIFRPVCSESPQFIGRAVAALANDPHLMQKSGHVLVAAALALKYGFTDIDGNNLVHHIAGCVGPCKPLAMFVRRSSRIIPMNTEIETEIRACEARLYTAMLGSDLAELDALIADELLFAGPTGELATKAMDLELHRSGATQFYEFTSKELEIRVWSESFALASAKIFLRGIYLGQAFAGDYRYTRIWRKGPHGWQVVGGSVTTMS